MLKCNMDGTNCLTYADVTGGHPNSVVIETSVKGGKHSKLLYWTDSRQDKITIKAIGEDRNNQVESKEIRLAVPL